MHVSKVSSAVVLFLCACSSEGPATVATPAPAAGASEPVASEAETGGGDAGVPADGGPRPPGLDPRIAFKDTSVAGDPKNPTSCDAVCKKAPYSTCTRIPYGDTGTLGAGTRRYKRSFDTSGGPSSLIGTCAEDVPAVRHDSYDWFLVEYSCNCKVPELTRSVSPEDGRTCAAVCADLGLGCDDERKWITGAKGGTFPEYDGTMSSAYACDATPPKSYKGKPITRYSCACKLP